MKIDAIATNAHVALNLPLTTSVRYNDEAIAAEMQELTVKLKLTLENEQAIPGRVRSLFIFVDANRSGSDRSPVAERLYSFPRSHSFYISSHISLPFSY